MQTRRPTKPRMESNRIESVAITSRPRPIDLFFTAPRSSPPRGPTRASGHLSVPPAGKLPAPSADVRRRGSAAGERRGPRRGDRDRCSSPSSARGEIIESDRGELERTNAPRNDEIAAINFDVIANTEIIRYKRIRDPVTGLVRRRATARASRGETRRNKIHRISIVKIRPVAP